MSVSPRLTWQSSIFISSDIVWCNIHKFMSLCFSVQQVKVHSKVQLWPLVIIVKNNQYEQNMPEKHGIMTFTHSKIIYNTVTVDWLNEGHHFFTVGLQTSDYCHYQLIWMLFYQSISGLNKQRNAETRYYHVIISLFYF